MGDLDSGNIESNNTDTGTNQAEAGAGALPATATGDANNAASAQFATAQARKIVVPAPFPPRQRDIPPELLHAQTINLDDYDNDEDDLELVQRAIEYRRQRRAEIKALTNEVLRLVESKGYVMADLGWVEKEKPDPRAPAQKTGDETGSGDKGKAVLKKVAKGKSNEKASSANARSDGSKEIKPLKLVLKKDPKVGYAYGRTYVGVDAEGKRDPKQWREPTAEEIEKWAKHGSLA